MGSVSLILEDWEIGEILLALNERMERKGYFHGDFEGMRSVYNHIVAFSKKAKVHRRQDD